MDSSLAGRVATVVADAIAARQMSLRDISDQTGIPTTTLHRRLHGHAPFTFAEIDALARVLGTTVTALVIRAGGSAA